MNNNNTEAAKASFAFSITIKGLDVLVPGPTKVGDSMSAKLEEFKLDLLIESATPATVYEAVGGIVETVCKTVMTMQKEDN